MTSFKIVGSFLALVVSLPGVCMAQPADQADEIARLRAQIAAQQKQLDEQRAALDSAQKAIAAAQAAINAQQKLLDQLSAARGGAPAAQPVTAAAAPSAPTAEANASPLSFKIGSAEFAPGGFMDFATVWRSTNIGSGVATSFAAVPMGNTVAGRMQEFRSSAANSRLTLTITENPAKNLAVTGYVEADFSGNQPASMYVTSNSSTLRMRHFWVDAARGKWEVLGGQTWTLLTPNRVGTSQVSSNVFVGIGEDSNYMPGLVWARPGQIRVTFHPNSHWSLAASVENPEQYVTTSVALPASVANQVDNGSLTSTPNAQPDIAAKIAYDTKLSGKAMHFEVGGFTSRFRTSPAANLYFNAAGVGGTADAILEVAKNFRLIATGFYGSGGGRFLTGLGPDFIVGPDGSISPVHAMSGILGFEYAPSASTQFFAYWADAYFKRNYTQIGPNSYLGFGYPGSASANKAFQEPQIGYYHTYFKSPKYGALQLITEYAYLTRAPWYWPAGTPSIAHAHMVFGSLRFTLP